MNYFSNHRFSGYDMSLLSAMSLELLENFVKFSNKVFKSFTNITQLISFLLLVIMPITYLFGFWFRIRRKKIDHQRKVFETRFKSIYDYISFTEWLNELDKHNEKLAQISTFNITKVPFFAKFMIREAKLLSVSLLRYNHFSHTRLNVYNKRQFSANGSRFVFVNKLELLKNGNN